MSELIQKASQEEGESFDDANDNLIVCQNLARQVKLDLISMLKSLAPEVYSHRTDIALVKFAAEAFITGEPDISLYKPKARNNMQDLILQRKQKPIF